MEMTVLFLTRGVPGNNGEVPGNNGVTGQAYRIWFDSVSRKPCGYVGREELLQEQHFHGK